MKKIYGNNDFLYENMPLLRPIPLDSSNTSFICYSKRRIWRLEKDWFFTYKK